jgi:hypothetical protein
MSDSEYERKRAVLERHKEEKDEKLKDAFVDSMISVSRVEKLVDVVIDKVRNR